MKTILVSIILATGLAITQGKAENCYNPNYVPGCISRGQVVCAAPVFCATPCDVAPRLSIQHAEVVHCRVRSEWVLQKEER